MTERVIRFDVLRYRPEQDHGPVWHGYDVPCQEDWVVLDALNHIKDRLDGTLSYRWSCHMGVCGSCGMMVDGEPKLACKAFLRDYAERVRVEPLENLAVERDLIVDVEGFADKLAAVQPYLMPEGSPPEGTYRQTPADLDRFRQYSMCINCLLCYAACPQVGLNPDYLGPAALTLAHRYDLDSRDAGHDRRAEVTASDEGIWHCTFVGECSEVCPQSVDPAGAIQQMKLAASLDYVLAPFGKGGSS